MFQRRDGRNGRYVAHKSQALDEGTMKSDALDDGDNEEESDNFTYIFEPDLTMAFEKEMDSLAAVVGDLEKSLDVQDLEELRELSVSMYEGLAHDQTDTCRAQRVDDKNIGSQTSSSSSRPSCSTHPAGVGWENGPNLQGVFPVCWCACFEPVFSQRAQCQTECGLS